MSARREAARVAVRALACLDLTNLRETATPDAIDALCAQAQTPHGPVAAVCIYPRFAARARSALEGTGIRVACVVNFPTGDRDLDFVEAMTADALAEGAEEIDLVIPWRPLIAGNEAPARETLRAARRILQDKTLKAILETGELAEPDLVARAAALAVAEGADFLKTSTGKARVNATPEAVEILLDAAKAADRPVGVKAAGGIRTFEDAAGYLALCDRIMGADWARPATFRLGASALLDPLLATIGGTEAATDADSPPRGGDLK